MDYHQLLLDLTEKSSETEDFDDKLHRILRAALPALPEDVRTNIFSKNNDASHMSNVRYKYLQTVIHVLQCMKRSCSEDKDEMISVMQFRTVKTAIELVISIGIVPCLIPGVGIGINKLCPRASKICEETLTDSEKYERLSFAISSLVELYNDITFRPAIIDHLGPLLTALLQLSHAPLMEPLKQSLTVRLDDIEKPKFVMTPELYKKLKRDQEEFSSKLLLLIANSPQPLIVRELMVILGIKTTPKWLRKVTQKYLVDRLMQPNGVISLIAAVCDDALDLGVHWNKLDTISKLIAAKHGTDLETYYKSICPQLLDLLINKQIAHSTTIANCCINALYECNPEICMKYILKVITAPLLISSIESAEFVRNESSIEGCIESLTKCFITVEAKFKHLPTNLLSTVAVPLFCLHTKIYQSACTLKTKIKQLVLRLLYEETIRENLYAVYLGHRKVEEFGEYVKPEFGPTGGVEITGVEGALKYEEYADSLFSLVSNIELLSTSLFCYEMKYLMDINKQNCTSKQNELIETSDDVIEKIQKQLAALKLLSNLANTVTVQEAQFKNPQALFSFIESLFNEYAKKHDSEEESDCEILYVCLMLVKMILNDRKKTTDWTPFNNFVRFLKENLNVPHLPSQIQLLMKEVIDYIETYPRFGERSYTDLSIDSKSSDKFERAVKDLTDPLLPVRAHGLVTLTKLIETKDLCTMARRTVVLKLFQENLKHEDSFIYLAAINGLCAVATEYPEIVLETLVQEFIDMPQRITSGEITVEARMKLGEILVKTTRGLGELAAAHKDILINGFLCATRDPDPLMRASSLSCIGELCKVLGFRLGRILTEVIYCISCIIKSDKVPECRRAAVLVASLLLKGLGKDVLTSLGTDLVGLFRGLKYLRDNDDDPVVRLHAQIALEELDEIMQNFVFTKPNLEKTIFLLPSS